MIRIFTQFNQVHSLTPLGILYHPFLGLHNGDFVIIFKSLYVIWTKEQLAWGKYDYFPLNRPFVLRQRKTAIVNKSSVASTVYKEGTLYRKL
jgi:hypothetical protein